MWARVATAGVGMWLFLSAFAWPHGWLQFTNTWIVGMLCTTFAVAAMSYPWLRHVNTLLALWLFVSSQYLLRPVTLGTMWNNALAALFMLVFSLVPGNEESPGTWAEAQPVNGWPRRRS